MKLRATWARDGKWSFRPALVDRVCMDATRDDSPIAARHSTAHQAQAVRQIVGA
jgi:hypothetical protein